MMKWTWKWLVIVFLYQSYLFSILFYFLHFFHFKLFISISELRKLIYQDCKQHVGAGINAWMSISDGLGPSIFCRRWKRRVLWWKRWMEKLFISRHSRHFWLWRDNVRSTFPYLYLDLAGKQLCFPPEKGINRRNESTGHKFLILWSTVDNNPVLLIPFIVLTRKTVKNILGATWHTTQTLLDRRKTI